MNSFKKKIEWDKYIIALCPIFLIFYLSNETYAIDYMNIKGEEISNDDIATIYPIFSILEDYDNLIKILSISVKRDNTNVEYLEVLRNAYMKVKDYENAENIYQIILSLQ